MVDTGSGDPIQVVCGAPNARAGMKGVFVPAGRLHSRQGDDAQDRHHPRRRIRGMLCRQFELLLSEDHEGIIELPDDAPVGNGFAQLCSASTTR